IVPGLSRVAILFNRTNHYARLALQSARGGAQTLQVILTPYDVYDTATLNAVFVTLTKDRPDGIMLPADAFLVSERNRIAQFAIEKKLPSVYSFREYIEAGGLMAYTPNYDDLFCPLLEEIINLRHPLVRLAGAIDWCPRRRVDRIRACLFAIDHSRFGFSTDLVTCPTCVCKDFAAL
ncbi:MAG: hypothetical protein E6G76_27725, partial [Alphaproteobacteria bacterium]